MGDVAVVDRFVDVFSRYIDSGFGLLGGEVAFLTATLVLIDMTLAGLFWAMSNAGGGGDEIIGKLIRKVLYVGAFAFIIGNFNALAAILFRSFAGLGLVASGSSLTEAQFLQPGRLAQVGIESGRPLMVQLGELTGFPEVFVNLDVIFVLSLAWLIVIVAFFLLAVQLFVTLIEFKLTTLAGFVLVPFALWNRTAFLAERVLGNVVSSGIKVLVLAVIVGIGTGLFSEFKTPPGTEPSIDHALTIMLASLALFGLGIFGPSIATGLVAGAPQLSAGAAAGTALAATGLAVAGGAAIRAGTAAAVAGARMAASGTRTLANGAGSQSQAAAGSAATTARAASAAGMSSGTATSANQSDPSSRTPAWATRLHRRQRIAHGASTVAHVVRSGGSGGSGATPKLNDDTNR